MARPRSLPRAAGFPRRATGRRSQAYGTFDSKVAATLTTALTGTNNDLKFTARERGTVGNGISITYVVAGNNTPLTVTKSGDDITVNVATSGGGAATSTAAQVAEAINGSAGNIVSVANAPGNDGSGVVTALAVTSLTGGTD